MPTLKQRLRAYETDIIKETLANRAGDVEGAARDLDLPLSSLYYKLRKLKINWHAYKAPFAPRTSSDQDNRRETRGGPPPAASRTF